jgi:hypothetical protein
MITIITWLWKPQSYWRTGYCAEDVNFLEKQLKENIKVPFKLVCVTDMPEGIQCETLPLWPDIMTRKQAGPGPNCWRRLWVFSKEAKDFFNTDKILSIDLDVLICGDITDIVTESVDFKITQKADNPRHYNGSLWMLKLGSLTKVWDEFDPETSPIDAHDTLSMRGIDPCGSDQSWFTHQIKGAPTWDTHDGIYHFWYHDFSQQVPDNAKLIFFSGTTKLKDLPFDHPLRQKIKGLL